MSADKLQWFRIKRAEELKDSVSEVYLEVMLRCLKGEFGQTGQEHIGQCCKEKVCERLNTRSSSSRAIETKCFLLRENSNYHTY